MINLIHSEEEFRAAISRSGPGSLIVFKHSTRCPISSGALLEMRRCDAPVFQVNVIEDRLLSNYIADFAGVAHASPQVIVFKGEKPVWTASHYAIRTEKVMEAAR
jgi:bacillithiol system protein YtxJ